MPESGEKKITERAIPIERGATPEGLRYEKHFDQHGKPAYIEFEDGSMQMLDAKGNILEYLDQSGKPIPIETKKK